MARKKPAPPAEAEDVLDDDSAATDSLGRVPSGRSGLPLSGGSAEAVADPVFLKHLRAEAERLDSEASKISLARTALWAEAKGKGYDVPVLRRALASLRRETEEVVVEADLFTLYREALSDG